MTRGCLQGLGEAGQCPHRVAQARCHAGPSQRRHPHGRPLRVGRAGYVRRGLSACKVAAQRERRDRSVGWCSAVQCGAGLPSLLQVGDDGRVAPAAYDQNSRGARVRWCVRLWVGESALLQG